jgi:hypothetical protein
MLHSGVDPGLLDEVQSSQTDDLSYWSLATLAVYERAAADRSDRSVEAIYGRIASQRGIPAAGNDSG